MDYCEKPNPPGPVLGLALALPISLAIWTVVALAIFSIS